MEEGESKTRMKGQRSSKEVPPPESLYMPLETPHRSEKRRSLAAYGEGCYPVTLSCTEISVRLNLIHSYLLEVGSCHLVLRDASTAGMLYEWPYSKIRKYGRSDMTFTFECGRRCSTGEGVFVFNTTKGEEIFSRIQIKLSVIKSQGINTPTPKPVGGIGSNTGERNSLPRYRPTATVQDTGNDTNQDSDYVEYDPGQGGPTSITFRPSSLIRDSYSVRAQANDYDVPPSANATQETVSDDEDHEYEDPDKVYLMSKLCEEADMDHDNDEPVDGYEQIDMKHPMKFKPPVTESPNLYDDDLRRVATTASSMTSSASAANEPRSSDEYDGECYYDQNSSNAPSADSEYSTVYQHFIKR